MDHHYPFIVAPLSSSVGGIVGRLRQQGLFMEGKLVLFVHENDKGIVVPRELSPEVVCPIDPSGRAHWEEFQLYLQLVEQVTQPDRLAVIPFGGTPLLSSWLIALSRREGPVADIFDRSRLGWSEPDQEI